MQRIVVSHAEAGRRLDNHLIKALPGGGLSFIHKMLRKKNITVNGRKCEGSYRLAEGDEICMFFSDETYARLQSADRNTIPEGMTGNVEPVYITQPINEYEEAYKTIRGIDIVYEDDDLIFIDKPAGILSQKGSGRRASVNEWLIGYLLDAGKLTPESLKTFKPAFANRLDRNTSGLMLGGKSLKALQLLGELLRDRNMHKYYLCIAQGHPDDRLPVKEDEFTDIYGYLVKDGDRNEVKVYPDKAEALKHAGDGRSGRDARSAAANGVSAIHTGFRLIRQYDDERMLLEAELHTGKSHQIRAQLAALGHPIAGDPKYGSGHKGRHGSEAARALGGSGGQMLHAYRVVFPDLPDWPAISGREFGTKGYKEEQYAEGFFG